jgi:hypothetical protein
LLASDAYYLTSQGLSDAQIQLISGHANKEESRSLSTSVARGSRGCVSGSRPCAGVLKKMASVVYQFKVVVKGIKPPVWRRVLVSGDSTLSFFHEVVQGESIRFRDQIKRPS